MASNTFRTRAIAAVAAGMLMASGAALAQGAGAPAAAQQQIEIAPVSDTEMAQFIEANRKVVELANEMVLERQNASTPYDAEAIEAEAEERMIAQIEEEGLTAGRYTQIVVLAETDPAFLAKLQAVASGG